MDNLDFNIDERYSLLCDELRLIKLESDLYASQFKSIMQNSTYEKLQSYDKRLEAITMNRKSIQLRLEILAKESYLEKLKASIDMDKAETERDYAKLDVDALLDRIAQYPAADERRYAKLMWMLSEFNFYHKQVNKEAVVFYAQVITKLLNGE